VAAFSQPQAPPVFRADVLLVKVDAQVVAGGRPVEDLRREDFIVKDMGVPQKIVYFGRDTEPLWVLLLLDVSGSMNRHLKQMAAAAREALAAMRPADHVGVMLFSRHTRVHQEFTSDFRSVAQSLRAAVEERGLGSGTRINAAVIDAAHHLRDYAGASGRRAIIILTDNLGLNYRVPNEEVLRALHEADAVLNVIATRNARAPRPLGAGANPDFTPSDVFLLARETGGETIRARQAGDALKRLLEGLRTRYSLHYRAPKGQSGQFRTIEVDVTPDVRERYGHLTIRARRGYYR